jgi:putative phosphoesterase
MKIGLLSDTHGYLNPKIRDYFSDVEEIWHVGDIGNKQVLSDLKQIAKVKAVYGNIDNVYLRNEYPEYLLFSIHKVKVLLIHIGGYPGKYTPKARQLILAHKPNLFISGHSHILKVMPDKTLNLLHINPGAAGIQGFHQISTVIKFEINEKIENLEVFEFPKRKV